MPSTAADQGFSLTRYIQQVERVDTTPLSGRVVRTVGLLIESQGPRVPVGALCEVVGTNPASAIPVQIVGFRDVEKRVASRVGGNGKAKCNPRYRAHQRSLL